MGSTLTKLIGRLFSAARRREANATLSSPVSPGISCRPEEACLKERLRSGSVSTTERYPSQWLNQNSLRLYDPYAALKKGQFNQESEKSSA